MKAEQYDYVFGIGEACSCSTALRRANLQIESDPLDWVAEADFQTRVKIVTSFFDRFLEAEDLVKISDNGKTDIYKNTRNGIDFIHDFPINVPFLTAWPEVKAKYDRRINRLLANIRAAKKALIVYMEIPNNQNPLQDPTELETALQAFKSAFPTTNFHLLYLSENVDYPYNARSDVAVTPEIRWVRVDYRGREWGERYPLAVNKRVLDRIFATVAVNRTFGEKVKIFMTNFLTSAVKLASAFIFNRRKRQIVRKRWVQNVRHFVWK